MGVACRLRAAVAAVAAAPGHVEAVRTHLFDQLTPAQVVQLAEISAALLGRLEFG